MSSRPIPTGMLEKLLIAGGLLASSALLYCGHYYYFGQEDGPGHYADKIFSHIAFLPIHALVLGMIIDGMMSFRERQSRQRKFYMFLGIFFRQMGADILSSASALCENRSELDNITVVQKDWTSRDFRRARQRLSTFKPRMLTDETMVLEMLELLRQREKDILEMTHNPLVLDFEDLYRGLISLFHLIEEIHYRNPGSGLSAGEAAHLAKDMGKSVVLLARLWLIYLEYLKAEHPMLFHCQVGVCSTIGWQLNEDSMDD